MNVVIKKEPKEGVREAIVRDLLFRPTFFPAKEIKNFAAELLLFFDSEDTHLEKTGLPSKQFDHWYSPFGSWQNLYFTKIPYAFFTDGKIPPELWKESLEKRDHRIVRKHIDAITAGANTAYVWKNWPPSASVDNAKNKISSIEELARRQLPLEKRMHGFSKFGYWINSKGEVFDDQGREVRSVSYEQAKRFPWLTLQQEKRIESSRANLLQSKIKILNHVTDFIGRKVPDDERLRKKLGKEFLEICAHTLIETVTPDEVKFHLEIESQYHENSLFNFGGLIPVLRTISFVSGGPLREYQRITEQLEKFRFSVEFEQPTYKYAEIPDQLLLKVFAQHEVYKQKLSELTFNAAMFLESLVVAGVREKNHRSKGKLKNKRLIQKRDDFKWSRVRVTLIDKATLLIQYDGKDFHLSFEDIGLFDGRGNQKRQNFAWAVLSIILKHGGKIPTETRSKMEKGSLRQQMMKIKRALKTLFGTNANPFEGRAKFTGLYEAKFLTGLGVSEQIVDMIGEEQDSERSAYDQVMDDFET